MNKLIGLLISIGVGIVAVGWFIYQELSFIRVSAPVIPLHTVALISIVLLSILVILLIKDSK